LSVPPGRDHFQDSGFAALLRQAALNAVDHATDKADDKAVKNATEDIHG
jgi:hypothetical protein